MMKDGTYLTIYDFTGEIFAYLQDKKIKKQLFRVNRSFIFIDDDGFLIRRRHDGNHIKIEKQKNNWGLIRNLQKVKKW